MTPLAGILIAVLAALLAPNTRAVVLSIVSAMIAATAVQTWDLGTGMGSNPPVTIDQPSYWLVQLIIIAIVTCVGVAIFRLRARRATSRGQDVARSAFSGPRGTKVAIASVLALTGLLLVGAIAVSRLTTNHGQGAADIPWTGVLGIGIGAVALTVLAAALILGSRSKPRVDSGTHDG